MSIKKKKLDIYIQEVLNQFITIKDDDYKKSQDIFKIVFDQVKAKMGENCNYFKKYSSQVMYAGSVYDGLKVSKLDEFDMDIVIRLPINYDLDIIIENDQPGFVKLKIGDGFDNLQKQQEWEKCHKVTNDWRDTDKYLLQNKFRQWMHGIVQKALNVLEGKVVVNGTTYLVVFKESGPAYTLNVQNDDGNEEFKLDVDLVPVIRFQHPRWPEGYRKIDGLEAEQRVKNWLVVPKPNKSLPDNTAKNRTWRLSFQEFEREMIKGCDQLKNAIRLVKKLRDTLQMKEIASYYIKTLFLWKIDKTKDKKYWQRGISVIFQMMVEELYNAIKMKNIPYFWHKKNNLIENLKPTIQRIYMDKLKDVLLSIESNNAEKLLSHLLTVDEFQQFKRSEFFQKQADIDTLNLSLTTENSREASVSSFGSVFAESSRSQAKEDILADLVKSMNIKMDALINDNKKINKIESSTSKIDPIIESVLNLHRKLDSLIDMFEVQNEKMTKLEAGFEIEKRKMDEKLEVILDKIDAQCIWP